MSRITRFPRHWSLALTLTIAQLACLGTAFFMMHRLARLGVAVRTADDPDSAGMMVDRALRPLALTGSGVMAMAALLAFGPTLVLVRRYQEGIERDNRYLTAEVGKRSRELMRTRDAVIFALAKLAEFRSHETGKHLERVQEYVEILARKMAETHPEIDEEAIETLKRASWLHDIGKVAIPDHLLVKAAPLSSSERDVVRAHSILGARCLEAIRRRLGEDDFLDVAQEVVMSHHERWDGQGYPNGTIGEQTPLSARIVAVADVYDALTSDRIYHAAISHEEACQAIREASGAQFDPCVVAAFVACEAEMRQAAERLRDSDDQSEELHLLGEIRELVQIVANRNTTPTPNWMAHLLEAKAKS